MTPIKSFCSQAANFAWNHWAEYTISRISTRFRTVWVGNYRSESLRRIVKWQYGKKLDYKAKGLKFAEKSFARDYWQLIRPKVSMTYPSYSISMKTFYIYPVKAGRKSGHWAFNRERLWLVLRIDLPKISWVIDDRQLTISWVGSETLCRPPCRLCIRSLCRSDVRRMVRRYKVQV